MPNIDQFPNFGNNKEEEKKIEEEESVFDEFEGDENKIENDESETENTNKSKSKGKTRSGFVVGALSALALLQGGVKEATSAEDMFVAKDKNTREQMIKSGMESEENSQEKTEWKAKVIKADTVLTDSQFAEITDSAGMVSVSELADRIQRYTPGIFYIGKKSQETLLRIQAEARMGRIEDDITIYAVDTDLFAAVTRTTNNKGKTEDVRTGAGNVPDKYPLDVIKKIKFVFLTK